MRVLVLLWAMSLAAQETEFGAVANVWHLEFKAGEDLLAGVQKFIASHKIQNGIVMNGVGNLDGCRYHSIDSKMVDAPGKYALINLSGPIVSGKPHLHVSIASSTNIVNGGHLEPGCKAASHVSLLVGAFK